jgi:hypothetical protein
MICQDIYWLCPRALALHFRPHPEGLALRSIKGWALLLLLLFLPLLLIPFPSSLDAILPLTQFGVITRTMFVPVSPVVIDQCVSLYLSFVY